MKQKIVLKVKVTDPKSKARAMKAVAKLQGIDRIEIDAEKGTVTVIGNVDPVLAVKALRRTQRTAAIESVGPYKEEEPKAKPKEPDPPKNPDPGSHACRRAPVGFMNYYDEPNWCSIL